jgi:RNase P subunit RPR2
VTAHALGSVQVTCPTCRRWMGEVPPGWKCVATIEDPRDRVLVADPRLTLRCKHCGWVMIFALPRPSWRDIELKQRTG